MTNFPHADVEGRRLALLALAVLFVLGIVLGWVGHGLYMRGCGEKVLVPSTSSLRSQ